MKKSIKGVLIGCSILAVLIIAGRYILFPPYDEIETTGSFEISCEDYWVTTDEPDPFLNDGSPREIQVRVWYPKGDGELNGKLPVVIASHGSCGSIDNNRSLCREFASHGYVVLAVSHPGHAMETLHSDGKTQRVSMAYLQETGSMDPQDKPEEAAAVFAKWMALRMTELAVVMDDFAVKTDRNPDRFGTADSHRFVAMGHSAGGSAALGMARIRSDVVASLRWNLPLCMISRACGMENTSWILQPMRYPC